MEFVKSDFNLRKSSTQYDSYKYKFGNAVMYSKRKQYRYMIQSEEVFDLRTKPTYKFIYLINKPDEYFNHEYQGNLKDNFWEICSELGILYDIIDHVKSIIEFNAFRIKDVILPDGLEDLEFDLSCKEDPSLKKYTLEFDWFDDDFKKTVESDKIRISIFYCGRYC